MQTMAVVSPGRQRWGAWFRAPLPAARGSTQPAWQLGDWWGAGGGGAAAGGAGRTGRTGAGGAHTADTAQYSD